MSRTLNQFSAKPAANQFESAGGQGIKTSLMWLVAFYRIISDQMIGDFKRGCCHYV
ncbi:MAG: hypothetical protein QOH39_1999 [Verrucomicrobiota bacterium]|jgi:hypothetical protein